MQKMEYKNAINKFKTDNENSFSDALNDALINKDFNTFWKSWNSKFTKKNPQSKVIEGFTKDAEMAGKCKDFFSNVCSPNTSVLHHTHERDFFDAFNLYPNDDVRYNLFTIEEIDAAVTKLKKGKAAGMTV